MKFKKDSYLENTDKAINKFKTHQGNIFLTVGGKLYICSNETVYITFQEQNHPSLSHWTLNI